MAGYLDSVQGTTRYSLLNKVMKTFLTKDKQVWGQQAALSNPPCWRKKFPLLTIDNCCKRYRRNTCHDPTNPFGPQSQIYEELLPDMATQYLGYIEFEADPTFPPRPRLLFREWITSWAIRTLFEIRDPPRKHFGCQQ